MNSIMGVTSEILGNSAPAHRLAHAGKTYSVRLIDQGVQAGFEKRLYEKDCAGVRIQREQGLLTEAQYNARLTELTDSFRDGDYEMMSARGLKVLGSTTGVRMLLGLLIDCPEGELIPLLLAKKTEITQLVRLVIAESFPGLELNSASTEATAAPASTEGTAPNAQAAA